MWCMHFIGLSGSTLKDSNNVELPTKYKLVESLATGLLCILFVYTGLFISSRDKMFCRDKEEILKLIMEESKNDSISAVRDKRYLLKAALFRGISPLAVSGFITGGGICIAHYVGMDAIQVEAVIEWDPWIVFASVALAVVVCTIAFWILFRLLALFPGIESLRILSSFIFATAMCGVHYTGMSAASYTVSRRPHATGVFGYAVERERADVIVTAVGVCIIVLCTMLVQAELRRWVLQMQKKGKESAKLFNQLGDRYKNDNLLMAYEEKNLKTSSTVDMTTRGSNRSVVSDRKINSDRKTSVCMPLSPDCRVHAMEEGVEFDECVERDEDVELQELQSGDERP